MANNIIVTPIDVSDPSLLVRLLQSIVSKISSVSSKVDSIGKPSIPLTIPQIKSSLQSSGSDPISVQALLGTLSEPQLAKILTFTTLPTGQNLQQLRDGQLFVVTGSPDQFYRVIGGNPNTVSTIISTGPANMVTTDTVQTISGVKTFGDGTNSVINLDHASAGLIDIRAQTGGVNRWITRIIGVEGGANAGSDWELLNFTDAGASIGIALSVLRATGNFLIGSIISSYNGMTTAGQGVPVIVSRIALTGQVASIGTTTLFTPTIAGEYRISSYMITTTPGTGNVILGIAYKDEVGLSVTSATTLVLTANTKGPLVITPHVNVNPITYTTTYTATGTYALYIIVERLS